VSTTLNIAIVDDDMGIIDVLKSSLKEQNVSGYTSSKEAISALKEKKFDLLILDYFVDELNADVIVKQIREFDKGLYIVLLTGYAESVPGLKSLDEMDIQSYIEKTGINDVVVHIKSAIKSVDFMKVNSNKLNVSFSNRLKELRKKFGVSQDDVAKYLEVGRTTIANYESGFTMPSVEALNRLASYFGVSIDYMLCREIGLPELFNK